MNKCNTCEKEFKEGDKVIQDRYSFELHCSEKCLIDFMCRFFYLDDLSPNTIIKNGQPEYIED